MRVTVLLLLAAILGAGCSGSRRSVEEPRDPNVVDAEDVGGRSIARVEDMLRGQVAGVDVYETPNGLVIRIRGVNTFAGKADPLFVIDGLPLEPGIDGALTGINPQDIASIRVLKNASETAAYGVRGANGVILITTKRPPPGEQG
jgi:TonB-dependent SusC/RagA subfamily outer membrane receptor